MSLSDLGRQIAEARTRLGLSPEALAGDDIDPASLTRIERGLSIRADVLMSILDRLGLRIVDEGDLG